jgi:hypothetical protein
LQMSGQEMDGLDMPTEATHKKGILLFASFAACVLIGTPQHSLYFKAVRKWFDNPRKYEVTRDIGELLDKTEYEDDLNLGGCDDEEEPTESDNEFIVQDEDDEDGSIRRGSDSGGSAGDGGVSDDEQVFTVGEGDSSEDEAKACSATSQIPSDKLRVGRRRRLSGDTTSSGASLHVSIS